MKFEPYTTSLGLRYVSRNTPIFEYLHLNSYWLKITMDHAEESDWSRGSVHVMGAADLLQEDGCDMSTV